jgi:hypothetical protein
MPCGLCVECFLLLTLSTEVVKRPVRRMEGKEVTRVVTLPRLPEISLAPQHILLSREILGQQRRRLTCWS